MVHGLRRRQFAAGILYGFLPVGDVVAKVGRAFRHRVLKRSGSARGCGGKEYAAIGSQYVAKIAGDQQPPALVALENVASRHAGRANLSFHLPQIQENKFGNFETLLTSSNCFYNRLIIIKFIK
jgi:hypothetical protein